MAALRGIHVLGQFAPQLRTEDAQLSFELVVFPFEVGGQGVPRFGCFLLQTVQGGGGAIPGAFQPLDSGPHPLGQPVAGRLQSSLRLVKLLFDMLQAGPEPGHDVVLVHSFHLRLS